MLEMSLMRSRRSDPSMECWGFGDGSWRRLLQVPKSKRRTGLVGCYPAAMSTATQPSPDPHSPEHATVENSAAPATTPDATAHHANAHHPNYWMIFLALCGLTALSWLLDESVGWGLLNSHVLLSVLVLAVALAKALFVAVYFMHLKFEGRWKYVLLLPTLVLAAGLPLALAPDLSFQYYPADTAQSRYLRDRGTIDEETAIETQAGAAPYQQGIRPDADDGEGVAP